MAIAASAVGSELPTHSEEVTVRRALAYAAGIGDTGPRVFDDDRQQGITLPPAFCVALEWPVVSDPATRDLLRAPREELMRGVHASQDSHFRRPLRPGDRLKTSGRIVALRATSAGALMLTRLETTDATSGEPVVESWSTSIYRGVDVVGEERVLEPAPELPGGSAAETTSVEIPISRQLPHVYTECARIWNPIHTERQVARAAGLPDIILHGTATWALAGREILAAYANGEPAALCRLHGRFRAMVLPGTTIRLEHGRGEDGTVYFTVYNHVGEEAIANGVAKLA